jgi:hypothetical protein
MIAELLAVCLLPLQAEEPVKGVRFTEHVRTPQAAQVKRIAIAPPVVVLRFDEKGRIPSPDRFTMRRAVAAELAGVLRHLIGDRKALALNETVAAALAERGWKPTDLYQTVSGMEEVLSDKKNVCRLAMSRSDLAANPTKVTTYHYRAEALKGIPDESIGLAVLERNVTPAMQEARIKALAEQCRSDAVLLLRVEDIDTKEGLVGLALENYKSSWVTVSATLVSGEDGRVLWQAALQGHSSTRERRIPGAAFSKGYNKGEDRLALDCMTKLAPVLVEKLLGTGGGS